MKIGSTFHFRNGMVATCDSNGKQILALQGRFSEVAQKILDAADTETEFWGWFSIPNGGTLTAEELRAARVSSSQSSVISRQSKSSGTEN